MEFSVLAHGHKSVSLKSTSYFINITYIAILKWSNLIRIEPDFIKEP